MINFFYFDQIALQIKSLLDDHLPPDSANNIFIGDLSVLPAPDRLHHFLPAVVIAPDTISPSFANDSSRVLFSPYSFTIYYIYPFSFEDYADSPSLGIRGALHIANVLLNFRTLDGFSIAKSASDAGGLVISSAVSNIDFNCQTPNLFRTQNFPALLAAISLNVAFRTFS